MRTAITIVCGFAVWLSPTLKASDEVLDRVDEALTWSAWQDRARLRVSGSLELEGYTFQYPAPGLIYTDSHHLLNPRLNLFLDAQLGQRFYMFAQSRIDRGFDPSDSHLQIRLDEYALRFSPRDGGAFNFQIGKFATVVGNWVQRHHAWDNPFITAPLPYEDLTGIFDVAAVRSVAALLDWSQVRPRYPGTEDGYKPYRLPVIWGPSYASGASFTGTMGKFDFAFEGKNASLSSRPSSWAATRTQWQHPTLSGRLGYRPDARWNLGFSASSGSYLLPSAQPSLANGHTLDDYRELVLGQDLSFAWHHWQIWAEAFETRFSIPAVGSADVFGYYFETKYKFTPQFSGALRWNQQRYSPVPNGAGGTVRWGDTITRLDLAPSFRFTPHTELKLQYSLQSRSGGTDRHSSMFAAQFIMRF